MKQKREFQPNRLHKVTKKIVIAITILSVIVAIITNYDVHANTQYTTDNIKMGFAAIKQCGSEYTSDNDINNCFNSIMEPYNSEERIANESLLIAIFLPLIFFGGSGIYRYLFPITQEIKTSNN